MTLWFVVVNFAQPFSGAKRAGDAPACDPHRKRLGAADFPTAHQQPGGQPGLTTEKRGTTIRKGFMPMPANG